MARNWSWRGRANEAAYQITLFARHRLQPVFLRSVIADGRRKCAMHVGTLLANRLCASEWSAAVQRASRTVAEIAVALQYTDANAFSRAFRNWAKRTPSA